MKKNEPITFRLKYDLKELKEAYINGRWIEFEDYFVSANGKVYSCKLTNRAFLSGGLYEISEKTLANGYKEIGLYYKNSKGKKCRVSAKVHRLVLEAFRPDRPDADLDKWECNHKDGDKTNNHLDNLEWVTHAQNVSHSYWINGRVKSIRPIMYDGVKYNSIVDCAKKLGLKQNSLNVILSRGQSTFFGKPISYAGEITMGKTEYDASK